MKNVTLVLALLCLTSCTVIRFTSGDITLTTVSFRPSGEDLQVDALVENVGKLTVGRTTDSSSEIVESVADVVTPGLF